MSRTMRLSLFALMACLVSLQTQAAELLQVDFGASPAEIASPLSTVRGTLPAGIEEDSGWADVTVDYSRQTDVMGSGLAWTRARVREIRRGHVQLKSMLPSINEPGIARLSLTAASTAPGPLRVLLREPMPPYTILHEEFVTLTPERVTYDLDFEISAPIRSSALFLVMGTPGHYDLYSLGLTLRTHAEMAETWDQVVSPANAVIWTSFPLGLPEGWSLEHGVAAPSSADSVRGTRPLRVETKRRRAFTLFTPPIPIARPIGLHTASFYARGDARGHFRVLCDGRELMSFPFEAQAEEQRIDIPFQPEMMGQWTVLNWEGTGTLEIDGVMVNEGAYADPYTPATSAWLALDAGRARGRISVEGVHDGIWVRYKAGAIEPGDQLMGQLFDLYGTQTELPPVDIYRMPLGAWNLAAFINGNPYGSWRLESWIEREGERVSPVMETVAHRVRQPRYWGRFAPESRFGNHFHSRQDHVYAAKAMGANWNRFHGGNAKVTYWSQVEPRPGEWRWQPEHLQTFLDQDIALCGVWTRVPGWARTVRHDKDGWLDNWWQPADYNLFAEYVRQTLREYGDRIQAWQIWNEPWGGFWFRDWRPDLQGSARWHPGPTPLEDFVELTQLSYDAAREVDPDMPLLGICATGGDKGKDWMADSLAAGLGELCDVLTFHSYFGGNLRSVLDPDSSDRWRQLRERIFDPIAQTPGAAERPIWITEGNWLLSRPDTGLYRHLALDHATPSSVVLEQSVLLPVYHAIMFSLGVEKIFSYALNGGTPYFRPVPRGQINWGALTTPSRDIHPSAVAYSAMAWHLETAEFERTLSVGPMTLAFLFRGPDAPHGVLFVAATDVDRYARSWMDHPDLVIEDFLGNPWREQFEITHQILYVKAEAPIDWDQLAPR